MIRSLSLLGSAPRCIAATIASTYTCIAYRPPCHYPAPDLSSIAEVTAGSLGCTRRMAFCVEPFRYCRARGTARVGWTSLASNGYINPGVMLIRSSLRPRSKVLLDFSMDHSQQATGGQLSKRACAVLLTRRRASGGYLSDAGGYVAQVKGLRVGQAELRQRAQTDGLLQDGHRTPIENLIRVAAVALQHCLRQIMALRRSIAPSLRAHNTYLIVLQSSLQEVGAACNVMLKVQ